MKKRKGALHSRLGSADCRPEIQVIRSPEGPLPSRSTAAEFERALLTGQDVCRLLNLSAAKVRKRGDLTNGRSIRHRALLSTKVTKNARDPERKRMAANSRRTFLTFTPVVD